MKKIWFILLITIGFLSTVVLYDLIKEVFFQKQLTTIPTYSRQGLILGALGETIRALFTDWLYNHHKSNKNSIKEAIRFGMVCTLLVGSLWLIVGLGAKEPDQQLSFLIDDGIILILQGLFSGIILWWYYKNAGA